MVKAFKRWYFRSVHFFSSAPAPSQQGSCPASPCWAPRGPAVHLWWTPPCWYDLWKQRNSGRIINILSPLFNVASEVLYDWIPTISVSIDSLQYSIHDLINCKLWVTCVRLWPFLYPIDALNWKKKCINLINRKCCYINHLWGLNCARYTQQRTNIKNL